MHKPFLFILAWISFVIGFIGIFIPLLPTTPFLILAAYLFSHSSEKFHRWILTLPFAGEAILEWREHRVVRTKAKILCSLMMVVSSIFIWSKGTINLSIKLIATSIMAAVLAYLLTRKSKLLVLVLLMPLAGCSTIGYVWEQGIGQLKIQWGSRDNEAILKDPQIDEKYKHKILVIEDAKKFFYHYFGKKTQKIYSQTYFLADEAVTYLVVASKANEIKAHEFTFPFAGSFPYIGFFSKKSAENFSKDLQKDELVTWIRPVYAYSTLGYFEDRILSSFFHYEDVYLVELVFHELFHTLFFVRDDVDINESLASYFALELLQVYYQGQDQFKSYQNKMLKQEKLYHEMVSTIQILKHEFDKLGPHLSDKKANDMTARFVKEIFKPRVLIFCREQNISLDDCWDDQDVWNQASFAAFMTYEEEKNDIKLWRAHVSGNLKDFFNWLKKMEKKYKKSDAESFGDFIQASLKEVS
jgi:predicted aminopeptidase